MVSVAKVTRYQSPATYRSTASRIYGLPEVHKLSKNDLPSDVKLRPIVSCVNCPNYNPARYLSDIMHKALDQEKFIIKDSLQFKNFIVKQKIPAGYRLVSFDVKSLFTSVP
jgi:hypothetical protein